MNKFWHLAKYNIIFNRVSIGFLTILSLVIISLTTYFFEDVDERGSAMMQYSFYVMFMIFTGKMNAKNSMMFDIKHLVGLPLSKVEIVFTKSLADTLQLIPIASVFLYGFSLSFEGYHPILIASILVLAVTFGNIIAFNKRIDFSRMQHSKASFKNSFLYLHKYLEMFIQIILAVTGVAIILTVFESNIFMQEYGFFIFMTTALFLSGFNTLKMLKDETRSYFIFKRDISRIAIKLFVVGLPLLAFHRFYKSGEGKMLAKQVFAQNTVANDIKKKLEKLDDMGNRKFLLMLVGQEEDKLKKYIADGHEIPWDAEIMGNYPMHIAVISGNTNIVKTLLDVNPDAINKAGKFKNTTPIFGAVRACDMNMIEFLIENNANLNHQRADGDTPIHLAAKRKCYGGAILLGQGGADLNIKNKEGKLVYDFISKRTGIPSLLKQMDQPTESLTPSSRIPASSESNEKN